MSFEYNTFLKHQKLNQQLNQIQHEEQPMCDIENKKNDYEHEEKELAQLKKMSDILTRETSRRLDEINSHINAIDLALESIIEMYDKTIEERDEVLLISLIRISNKYRDQFEVWKQFLNEDATMVADITKRFSTPKAKDDFDND